MVNKRARPEVELLLCCAAPDRGSVETGVRRADRIRGLCGQQLDWDYLLQLASAHAVTPLLFWGLKASCPEAIPASLAQRFQENAFDSMRRTGDLLQLLDLFARERIPVLPFKGPTLAISAHGNLALRQFVDLDLLLRKEDALRARHMLVAHGYRNCSQLSVRREEAYLRVYDEFVLIGPGGSPLVELHWAVTPRYFSVPLDVEPFFPRAVAVPLGKRQAPTPCAEDMLLVLCLHGAKHCWTRLSMVSDIAWLVTARNVRWEDVLERAGPIGARRMVLLSAELVHRLFGLPLPEQILRDAAADPAVQALATQVTGRMWELRSSPRTISESASFHMKSRERWQDRLRYLVRLATTSGVEDWELVDLPQSLAFLYLPLRFPRLLKKYWMRIP